MGNIRGGRLRRLAFVMSFGVLTALAVAGATSARVDVDSSGSAPAVWLAETPESVTFCHVAGRADDPANTVTLTLPYNAVFGQAGHFNEDGTPQAGPNTTTWDHVRRRLLRQTSAQTSTATRPRFRMEW